MYTFYFLGLIAPKASKVYEGCKWAIEVTFSIK